MKKLLLFLLAFALPATAMHKRKREEPQSGKIKFGKARLDKQGYYNIKAKEKGSSTTAGTVTFNHAPGNKNIGNIYTMYVAQEHRNKGIGYQLFKKAIIKLKKQGYPEVTWLALSTVAPEQTPTHKLEEIYISMVRKIAEEIDCNLVIGSRKPNDSHGTSFRLIFK